MRCHSCCANFVMRQGDWATALTPGYALRLWPSIRKPPLRWRCTAWARRARPDRVHRLSIRARRAARRSRQASMSAQHRRHRTDGQRRGLARPVRLSRRAAGPAHRRQTRGRHASGAAAGMPADDKPNGRSRKPMKNAEAIPPRMSARDDRARRSQGAARCRAQRPRSASPSGWSGGSGPIHFSRLRRQDPVSMAGAYEREAIRPLHVLGRFGDMLQAAEGHPAMLFYLDNWNSIGAPNSVAGINRTRGLNENPRARDSRTAYARCAQRLHAS